MKSRISFLGQLSENNIRRRNYRLLSNQAKAWMEETLCNFLFYFWYVYGSSGYDQSLHLLLIILYSCVYLFAIPLTDLDHCKKFWACIMYALYPTAIIIIIIIVIIIYVLYIFIGSSFLLCSFLYRQ